MLQHDIPVINTTQMQEIDRLMIDSYGITLLQMMENAGYNLACMSKKYLGGSVLDRKILIVAGGGNKGGAGLVSARHLSNWGAEVTCLTTKPPAAFKPAAANQLEIIRQLPVSVAPWITPPEFIDWTSQSLVIDAMIGHGLHGKPDSVATQIILRINNSGLPVISLDIPSGLHACDGYIADPVVRADVTLSLALPKQGLFQAGSRAYAGEIYIGDISVPPLLFRQIGLQIDQSIFNEETIIHYTG